MLPQAALAKDDEYVDRIDRAWVKLFEDTNYQGERLSINYPQDVPDMRRMSVDRGRDRGNNIASSAHYAIPRGWALRLYTGADYKGDHIDLVGTGRPERKALPANFRNKVSSAKWVSEDIDRDRRDDRDWDRSRDRDRSSGSGSGWRLDRD
jgi:hypothetical protein